MHGVYGKSRGIRHVKTFADIARICTAGEEDERHLIFAMSVRAAAALA